MSTLIPESQMGDHAEVLKKMNELYFELFQHNGFGQMRLEMRFLKKGQKEVVLNCGKEYRFVLNYPTLQDKEYV